MKKGQPGRGPRSAAEVLEELERDARYLDRRRERQVASRLKAEEYAKAAAPLMRDLARSGFKVDDLGELRRSGTNYREAIPLLLKWLPIANNPDLKEDIVRTLSVPYAKSEAASVLVHEFRNATDPTGSGLRRTIANGLAIVADDVVFDEIVELARDRRNGKAREMLTLSLGNMSKPAAADVLIEFLDDGDLVGHAVLALGRLKARAALPHLQRLRNHPRSWVRAEVGKALARIES